MIKGELFNTDMVRAYLEGRKKHTARPIMYGGRTPISIGRDKLYKMIDVLNGKPFFGAGFYKDTDVFEVDGQKHIDAIYFKAKYRPGDYMYCREAYCPNYFDDYRPAYKADYRKERVGDCVPEPKWTPSIHMPREAARLFFRVTRVEVMRLEDVTEQFAIDDGFQANTEDGVTFTVLDNFRHFWLETYGLTRRWMWVYWTEPVSKEEALKGDNRGE